ncbi:MAG: metallophosphoesterase [Pseudomonadota bacterium]|nr:metallophosphoesterase [Pseudomonadota bacterium]
MKLVVLSDIHIDEPDTHQKFPDNLMRLETAIDRIHTVYDDADLVVFAGDLVDRGRRSEPYKLFQSALARLALPYALTLGNHDGRDTFRSVFGATHCDPNGYIQSAHELDGTCVIVLDTASDIPAGAGRRGASDPKGQLCSMRLSWLAERLRDSAGQPVIVILHHPPLCLGVKNDPWVLQEPKAFIDLLTTHGDVRQVLSGHIHLTSTAFYRGIPFTTLAGNCTTTAEDFGRAENKVRRTGPAQMAIVLSDAEQTTVHFDNYVDANPAFSK